MIRGTRNTRGRDRSGAGHPGQHFVRAKDAPLNDLITATVAVIDRFLAAMPTGMSAPGYSSDKSDTITGYRGIWVFGYTNSGLGVPVVQNLQVNGPEPLCAVIEERYRDRFDPWGRGHGHLVLHLNGQPPGGDAASGGRGGGDAT